MRLYPIAIAPMTGRFAPSGFTLAGTGGGRGPAIHPVSLIASHAAICQLAGIAINWSPASAVACKPDKLRC